LISAAAFLDQCAEGICPKSLPSFNCVLGARGRSDIAPFNTSIDLERRRALVRGGFIMDAILKGRWILVVEDQPLVVLDIADSFSQAGASVLSAATLQEGLPLAEHPQLSAAILDFGLRDGDSGVLCARLTERGIPFVVYTGYDQMHEACRAGVLVRKLALLDTLLKTVVQLLEQK
jgi:CheY-like chemotaxis protein